MGKPAAIYFRVYLGLLALAAVTTGIAFVDLGKWALPTALGIAALKSVLVVLYFMHVRTSSSIVRLFAGTALFWLLILIGLAMSDVATRTWLPLRAPPGP